MKVIGVDNLDRETVSDVLIKENISEEEARKIAKEHNESMGDNPDEYYYRVVADNYPLYKFEP